jgi:hypothetical protein
MSIYEFREELFGEVQVTISCGKKILGAPDKFKKKMECRPTEPTGAIRTNMAQDKNPFPDQAFSAIAGVLRVLQHAEPKI